MLESSEIGGVCMIKGRDIDIVSNYDEKTVFVNIPMPCPDGMILSKGYDYQDMYIGLRDDARIIEKKVCYDRARATCLWAECCSADLRSQIVIDGVMTFEFVFPNLDLLNKFEKDAITNISGATMSYENIKKENMIDVMVFHDYANVTASVKIPMPLEEIFLEDMEEEIIGKDLYDIESMFIYIRDNAKLLEEKICFDRARAVCLWANCCNANLISHDFINGEMIFNFNFPSLDLLNAFEKDAISNIRGATMSEGFERKIIKNH